MDQKRLGFVAHTPSIPRRLECIESLPPALRTGSVPCGQGRGLIQKEEFRIESWRHNHAASSLEFQLTSDPRSALVLPDDLTVCVVNRATAISHQRPSRRRAEQVSRRAHTIL